VLPHTPDPGALFERIESLTGRVEGQAGVLVKQWAPESGKRSFRFSAANLAAYLALRDHDVRKIQHQLAAFGLSSLGRCESRVLPSLRLIRTTLGRLSGREDLDWAPHQVDFDKGLSLIERRADTLFGKRSRLSKGRIMVTLPTHAATDKAWCAALLEAGASCARINTAHDDPDTWRSMIDNIRDASLTTGRPCRIHIDLTGPRARLRGVKKPQPVKRVFCGDVLILARSVADLEESGMAGGVCSLPSLVDALQPGHTVYFNEGKLGMKVLRKTRGTAVLEVFRAGEDGEKLKNDQAINAPQTSWDPPPLTESDIVNLDFVMEHADLVGYSFVQKPEDMDLLESEIAARRHLRGKDRAPLAVVAKIETALAVRNLPGIMLHGAVRFPFAVMIARGDLAVELGPVRIAEIQEEILWLCEAAHLPVIWATQVLENLAKQGFASRAELTDAAMSERAECVMLNKGSHILDAVSILAQVQARMRGHQRKKFHTLRPLKSWHHLMKEHG